MFLFPSVSRPKALLHIWVLQSIKTYIKSTETTSTLMLSKIKLDIHRWRNLKTSLQGRINTVKMNILPHLNFLFFTPSLPPPNYFKYILSMISILSMMGFILDGRWPWVCLNCSDPNCWVAGTLLLVISDQSI